MNALARLALPLLLGAAAGAQETADAPRVSADSEVLRHGAARRVKLDASDRAPRPDAGPGRAFVWVSESRCAGYVWARSEDADPALRLARVGTDEVLENDDGGGGTNAWIRVEVEPGAEHELELALKPGEEGEVELRLLEVPLLPAGYAARLEHARESLARARALLSQGNREEAGELAVSATAALQELRAAGPGGLEAREYEYDDVISGLWKAGELALALKNTELARAAWEPVLAHRLATLPEEHALVSSARGNVALTLRAHGDYRGACALEEAALAVRERVGPETHPFLARARRNLALTYKALGRYEEARALEEAVVRVYEQNLKEIHPRLWEARRHLAATLLLLGEDEAAQELAARTVAVMQARLGPNDLDLLRGKLLLARTLRGVDRREEALALQERVLAIFVEQAGADHPYVQQARLDLARTALQLGRVEQASALVTEALAQLSDGLPPGHPELALAELLAAEVRESEGREAEAHALAEEAHAVLARTVDPRHPELLRAAELADRTAGARAAGQDAGGEDPAGLLVPPRWLERLPEGRALVKFFLTTSGQGGGTYVALSADGSLVELAPKRALEEAVRGWLAASDEERPAMAGILRALAWDPVAARLGDARRVVLIPEGVLHWVPFDALPAADGEGYLGDAYRIEVLPRIELLAREDKPPGHLLVLAGCLDDGDVSTEREARRLVELSIEHRVVGTERYVSKQARAKPLPELARRARYFHLATRGGQHALAEPGEVGLRICMGPGEDEVRVLGAPELRALDLSRCELAVASAGGTLQGLLRAGEPPRSVHTALHDAGARLVLGSVLPTEDGPTEALMEELYEHLWKKRLPPDVALWRARESLREAGAPYSAWAGWILTGPRR